MRRIHKEDLWKIYLTLWGGSFVPVYMLSFPLVSWLICDVLALFFCLIASPRIQGLPFDLQKERSSGMCLERIAIGISLKRKKGWGYPAVLKERDKSTGFFFLFFLPVLERERDLDPLVVPVTTMLMHYCSHSMPLWEVLYMLPPDIRRPANCKRLPASQSRNALLIGLWSLQIKFKKRNFCKCIFVCKTKHLE